MSLHANLKLATLTDAELLVMLKGVSGGLGSHTPIYPNPPSPPPVLDQLGQTFSTQIQAKHDADLAAHQATQAIKKTRENIHLALTDDAKYVETQAHDDETKLREAGFEPRAAPVHRHDVPALQGLSATLGDQPGQVDLAWHHPRSHQVQAVRVEMTTDPSKPETFHGVDQTKGSKITLSGLTHGATLSFRVVALGGGGRESAPSTVVTITVA